MENPDQNVIALEDLIDFYVKQGMMKDIVVDSTEKQKMFPILHAKILDSIREEVKRSLTKDEANDLSNKAKEIHHQHEVQQRAKQIRDLLLEGIILSFIVGLLVNLVTEPINPLPTGIKIILAIVFAFIVAVIFFSLLWVQIQDLLYSNQKGDSSSP